MKLFGPRCGIVCAVCWLLLGVWSGLALLGAQTADAGKRERITTLRTELARHDDLYFKQAKPEITDAEYDRLKRELMGLETAHPELAAPVRAVGDDRSGRFPVQPHRERMLSLDKAYTEAEWRAFHAKLISQLGQSDPAFVIEPKYDGLAISLTYERGVLVRAVTRGNGAEGDDVTANVRTIGSLPTKLDPLGGVVPALVELRGEIYLGWSEFARLNAAREAAGEGPFAHPRNLAAGTVKSTDPAEVAQRLISLVIHGWGAWEGTDAPASQRAFHAQVEAWGLPAMVEVRSAHTVDAVWAAVRALGQERNRLSFPIDGAVVKLDDTVLRARLGEDDHAPRWAIACKYEPERAVTRLRAIILQVGRTGVLTPVAEFDPVELSGSTVTRASLHNRDEIARRDIRVGDFIEVEKAGEIIPVVLGVQRERRPADAAVFVFPGQCPSCAADLVSKPGEAAVRCSNGRCPAQRQRRLEHFTSPAAVDIPGFGPATIAALMAAGVLDSPADFYRLQEQDLRSAAGLGDKPVERLLAEIEWSKTAELWRFIHGLGLPQVGEARAQALARKCGDLMTLAKMDAPELTPIVGGAVATPAAEFLARPETQGDIRAMVAAGVRPRSPGVATKADLRGKVFVFTGTLPGLGRAQAVERVLAAGGVVREGVSGQTDYVVAGEGAGAKLAEAQKRGVKVIDGAEFERMVGEE